MNALEALAALEEGKTVYNEGGTGWYNLIDEDYITFGCSGDYPCCHCDYTVEEFLDYVKDENLKLK